MNKNTVSLVARAIFVAALIQGIGCSRGLEGYVKKNQEVIDAQSKIGDIDSELGINNAPTCGGASVESNNLAGARLSFNLKELDGAGRDPDGTISKFQFIANGSDYLLSNSNISCMNAPCDWGRKIDISQDRPAGNYHLNYVIYDESDPPQLAQCSLSIAISGVNKAPIAKDMVFRVAPGKTVDITPLDIMDPDGNKIDKYKIYNPNGLPYGFSPACPDAFCNLLGVNIFYTELSGVAVGATYNFKYAVQDSAGAVSNQAELKIIVDPSCGAGMRLTESYDFKVDQANRDANVVFVVDTSGSMKDEIESVRANMNTFVSGIKDQFDTDRTKFLVMGSKYGSSLELLDPSAYSKDALSSDVYWHYRYIHSRNKLQATMKLYNIFDVVGQDGANHPLLGNYTSGSTSTSVENFPLAGYDPSGTNCNGPDAKLYNCGALNHIVVVTDDKEKLTYATSNIGKGHECTESATVSCNQDEIESIFMNNFSASLSRGENSFRFHAIHGMDSSSCNNYDSASPIYSNIAAQTGGLSLDICNTDWSSLFDALKNSIVESISSSPFGVCPKVDREIEKITLTWDNGAGGPVEITSGWVYLPPKGNEAARIYIPKAVLVAAGVPVVDGLMIHAEISYTLR